MNKERAEGKFDQAAGKLKQKVGEAVGNEKLANAGAAEQVKGALKETWGRTKEAAQEPRSTARTRVAAESAELRQRTENAAHDIREKITSTAQNVKDRVNHKLDTFQHHQQQEREDIRQVH
jgi:uncharacterized protein YjbJ (UPF0337 family)